MSEQETQFSLHWKWTLETTRKTYRIWKI